MQTALPAETRTLLENIRWETFVELSEQRHGSVPRMTFDEGMLELMSPKRLHEGVGCLLGRMVETFTEVHGIEIQSVASTTFKRRDLEKAFEADESYYIENAERIRAKEELDLRFDPPPDLVIEVEITSSAIQKMKLFAAMGVPEVWRHDGQQLTMHRLRSDCYESIVESAALPGFTCAAADAVLAQRFTQGETALITQYRHRLLK